MPVPDWTRLPSAGLSIFFPGAMNALLSLAWWLGPVTHPACDISRVSPVAPPRIPGLKATGVFQSQSRAMVTVKIPESEIMDNQASSGSIWRDELVMFGDSITQFAWQKGGTGAELADYYQRRLDLVNRGYSGYNTTWALHVAKTIFPAKYVEDGKFRKKRIVTIWLGANDAVIPPKPQTVEVGQFKANMGKLIDMIEAHDQRTRQTHGGEKVLIVLITPPPISISMRAADCAARFPDWKPENMDRDPIRTRQFAESVCEVAKERGLPVIDCWTAITKAAGDDLGLSRYLCDGLHLTPDGYEIVTREFKTILSRHYPHLLPENLPHDFPWWSDIDFAHPENSFPETA